jgi:hypothetical protein
MNPSEKRMHTGYFLEMAEKIARDKFDGHLTIMKFTTHWKAMFGTPNLDVDGRAEVRSLSKFDMLDECLRDLVIKGLDA